MLSPLPQNTAQADVTQNWSEIFCRDMKFNSVSLVYALMGLIIRCRNRMKIRGLHDKLRTGHRLINHCLLTSLSYQLLDDIMSYEKKLACKKNR